MGFWHFRGEMVAIRLARVSVGHLVGNVHIMERAQLLAAMLDAKTPNESSTAIYSARLWLADHPDDQTVWSAMADLIEVERQSMSHA